MPAFPITRGTSQALYPFTQTITFLTEVCSFVDGSQQRFVRRKGGAIVKFEFPYSKFSQAQKDTIKTAVIAAKGQQSTSFTVTLGGVTYTNLSLESDIFTATERVPTQYSMPITLKGITAQALTASGGGAFPTFSYGTTTQLPFDQGHVWNTQFKLSDSGRKLTYAFWSAQLQQWKVNYPNMVDADVPTLIQHFVWAQGRYQQFTFTDPEDSTAYTKAHYASDDLVIRYNNINSASVSMALETVR